MIFIVALCCLFTQSQAMTLMTMEFADSGNRVRPGELSEFLALFQAAYIGLRDVVGTQEHNLVKAPMQSEIEELKGLFAQFSPRHLRKIFGEDATAPQIASISQQSPLEIIFIGSAFLLVFATVLSGGKIQITGTGVKAALPPLGAGIKALREAFAFQRNLNASFGINEATIKLNATEFHELMTVVTGEGGFQGFIRSLQQRINKQTRELTLSPQDIERIYRHKAHPLRGGWQARFHRIFERHFPGAREQ